MKNILLFPKNFVDFFRQTYAELKLIEWLKASKVVRYTLSIIMFLFFGALAIILIDRVFLLIRSLIIPV